MAENFINDNSYSPAGQKPYFSQVIKLGFVITSIFGNNHRKGVCQTCPFLCYNKVCPNCRLVGYAILLLSDSL